MYPLVRELAATGTGLPVPVAVSCRILKLSKQGYYQWLNAPVRLRALEEAKLLSVIRQIHGEDSRLGYRQITYELIDRGYQVSARRVWRICHKYQMFSTLTRRRKGMKKPKASSAAGFSDHVHRCFTAYEPDCLWVTDLTEHPTMEGKLYLATVKDVYSRRILGYATGERMTSTLAIRALKQALVSRSYPRGVTVHSDRGSQFLSRNWAQLLKIHHLVGSMGRVGAAGDNAAAESFFSLLQKNVLNQQRTWPTRARLRAAITYWIEATYHRKRRQQALGGMTPLQYELEWHQAATAA